jgi:dTDP-4-amino-4,6-dideoxygalactose transaminase
MASQQVPFLDLITPHAQLKEELMGVVEQTLATGMFTDGALVQTFEQEFAAFCGTHECVGVNSGTDALRFALLAASIKPGDVVVTAPNSFVATVEAICQVGAIPEFVDVDESTCNMSPTDLERYLSVECSRNSERELISRRSGHKVTAIVPVHLYGSPADMDPIIQLAEDHNLVVVEDACQAHGSEYYSRTHKCWMRCGSMGKVAAFSFYPGKNLGACGEAGAVTTNEKTIAELVRMVRNHGQQRKYYHDLEGYNGRLDALQAGFLSRKLKYLEAWNDKRRECARKYDQGFSGFEEKITTPYMPEWSRSNYHLYVLRVDDRDSLQRALTGAGIGSSIHYPVPLHLQKAYLHLGYRRGDFPVTETLATRIISLPMFPQLTHAQIENVVAVVSRAMADAKAAVGATS